MTRANPDLVRVLRFTGLILSEICALHLTSRACSLVLDTITTGPDFLVAVSDRGHPISGLRLRVAGTQVITDNHGVAAFHHIAPGQYVVAADHDDGVSDAVNLVVKTNGPRNLSVHLRWPAVRPIEVRSLTGTLSFADTSPRMLNIYVLEGLSGRVLQHAETTSGGFNFPDLSSGFYFLRVRQARSTPTEFAPIDGLIGVKVNPSAQQERLNVVLGMTSCGLMYTNAGECSTSEIQMRSLSGQVVDGEGSAIPSADVLLLSAADRRTVITTIKTDSNGNFVVHELPAGSYPLEIAAPGFTPARATIQIRSTSDFDQSLSIQLGLLGQCSAVNIR